MALGGGDSVVGEEDTTLDLAAAPAPLVVALAGVA